MSNSDMFEVVTAQKAQWTLSEGNFHLISA